MTRLTQEKEPGAAGALMGASASVIGIDVGGTFTDLCAHDPTTGAILYHKRPSTPARPADAILEGLEELCRQYGIDPAGLQRIAHGTTVGTNALIQGRGGRVALIVTKGFRDLLEIGRQVRPKIYDLQADHPAPLVPRHLRFEIDERITAGGRVERELADAEIERVVEDVRRAEPDAVAVCLLFSYIDDSHERRLGEALRRAMPQVDISLSCEVRPEFREYERLSTTVLNAYLQPVMSGYLTALETGARKMAPEAALGINQSSGGLISAERARRFPIRTSVSGPAAGVAGALEIARQAGEPDIITLDIGGTSSDVSLIRGMRPRTIHERWIEGYPARLTSIDIDAIGAGGGSIAWVDVDGLLKVGPQSAGAYPGPACYGRGGTRATVSDANLLVGRLSPEGLLSGRMPMQADAAERVIGAVADEIGLSKEWTALGIIDIAVANMVRGIRAISVERGLDPRQFTLLAFGGAGPLHASVVARAIGIKRILVPAHPGLLCAQGLIVADQLEYFVRTIRVPLDDKLTGKSAVAIADLDQEADRWFREQGIRPESGQRRFSLDMRYLGQNFELSLPIEGESIPPRTVLEAAFSSAHDEAYGFHNAGAPIEIVSVRLAASGRHPHNIRSAPASASDAPQTIGRRAVWFDRTGPVETAIYDKRLLGAGHEIRGPAIVEQLDTTTLVFPGDIARIDPHGNILIEVQS